MLWSHIGTSICSHHPDPGRRAQHRGQQLEGVGSGPLQIIQQQEHPAAACHVGQVASHRPEHEVPLLLRCQPQLGRLDPQVGQQLHQPAAALQRPAPIPTRAFLDGAFQHLQEGGEGLSRAVPMATSLQHRHALRRAALHLLQQPGLADSRFPGKEQHGWARSCQMLLQQVQLPVSPNDGTLSLSLACSLARPPWGQGRHGAGELSFSMHHGGGGSTTAGNGILQRFALLGRQPERLGQQRHGVPARCALGPALQVADRARTHAGSLSQLLLRQARSNPVPLEKLSKARRRGRFHGIGVLSKAATSRSGYGSPGLC
jgi:hypothetical protein